MTRKGLWSSGGGAALLLLAASSAPVWAQEIYVASLSGNSVSRVSSTGVVSTFATGFSTPYGIAFNSSREMFVANFGNGTISRVSQSGVVSTLNFSGATLTNPVGVAFAPNGDLYVSNRGSGTTTDGSIVRITPQGVATTFMSGLMSPADIQFSGTDLYVSNSSGSGGPTGFEPSVYKITAAGVKTSFFSLGVLPTAYGLAVASNGDVYGNSLSNGRVSRRPPTGTITNFLPNGSLTSPTGMAFGGTDLFVAQNVWNGSSSVGTVSRVSPAGTITTFATGVDNPSGLAYLLPGVAVPEPGSLALLGLGGIAMAGWLRRRGSDAS